MKNIRTMQFFEVYNRLPIEIVKGQGAFVFDEKGNKYLDFYGGHAVISIGHNHPVFTDRVGEQLRKLPFYSNAVVNPLQNELADHLGRLSGLEEYQLFLCNSGAEANENALKQASFLTDKTKVLAFKGGFHGRTSAAVNVTDNAKIKAPINTTFETVFIDLEDRNATLKVLEKGDVCACIIEGIQGIGGIQLPSSKYLEFLSENCRKYGVKLILDEIQSGYGRSGHFFAFQSSGIQPDMITMAKGMGNGFPIGGVLFHPDIEAKKGSLGTTFGGNHLACTAGLAVLEVIENKNLMENARRMGAILLSELRTMRNLLDVRGTGLMIGIEMNEPIGQLRKKLLLDHRIFTGSSSNPNVLRLLPPLNITQKEAEVFLTKFKRSL